MVHSSSLRLATLAQTSQTVILDRTAYPEDIDANTTRAARARARGRRNSTRCSNDIYSLGVCLLEIELCTSFAVLRGGEGEE
ncbi:hypothetical protein ACO22_08127, partial [Paracoccidioides brasiliensis]